MFNVLAIGFQNAHTVARDEAVNAVRRGKADNLKITITPERPKGPHRGFRLSWHFISVPFLRGLSFAGRVM